MSRKGNRQKPLASSIVFFHKIISGHTAVSEFNEVDEDIYEIKRTNERPAIRVLVVDIYVVSEADIFEILSENLNLDCILLIGFNNNYSNSAKELAKSERIGLFDVTEFRGAIHYTGQKLVDYEPKTKNNRNDWT